MAVILILGIAWLLFGAWTMLRDFNGAPPEATDKFAAVVFSHGKASAVLGLAVCVAMSPIIGAWHALRQGRQ